MFSKLLKISTAAMLLSACSAQPHTQFHKSPSAPYLPAVLPEGVAVLYEHPACDYNIIGEAWVTHHKIDITPSRVKALQAEAAAHGADAILLHPNRAYCKDGSEIDECPGRGEYVVATAIQYLGKLEPPLFTPTLEPGDGISYEEAQQLQ